MQLVADHMTQLKQLVLTSLKAAVNNANTLLQQGTAAAKSAVKKETDVCKAQVKANAAETREDCNDCIEGEEKGGSTYRRRRRRRRRV